MNLAKAALSDSALWLINNSTDAVLVVDETGLIENINPAWSALTGWSVSETLGRASQAFLAPPDLSGTKEGKRERLSKASRQVKRHLSCKGGAQALVGMSAHEAHHGRRIVVFKDLSLERRPAEEVAQTLRTGDLLREAAGVLLWRYNPDDNIVRMDYGRDPAGQQVDGGSACTPDQRALLVHPDDLARYLLGREACCRTGMFWTTEYRRTHDDGGWSIFRSSMQGLRMLPSGLWELCGVTQDVSELILARDAALRAEAEARRADAAKSQFLAHMSHEIRTPLNGVLGMAQVMAAEPLPTLQRDRLAIIQQSGESLLHILNDILDLSKIEAGRLVLEEVEFDLSALIHSAWAIFSNIAERKGLQFSMHIHPEAAGSYRGDAVRMRQILYNLISNALKFTASGEVTVTVSRHKSILTIEVADSGIGMTQEALAKLFDRFVQADASTTRRYGGTGLGLSICQELAQLMGGRIEAHSLPDQGTTLNVSLPLPRTGDEVGTTSEDPYPAQVTGDLQECALRVLVAEDHPMNQIVLRMLLEQVGIDPVMVGSGALAVQAWQDAEWDVILMDIQMPELDGVGATRHIREVEAKSGRTSTPIIALTANALSHQVASYMEAGMNDFVAKPIEANRLYAALQKVVAQRGSSPFREDLPGGEIRSS